MELAGSVAALIAALARRTGAPQSFVDEVRNLFRAKGISLEREAGPYVGAIVETFEREAAVRRHASAAREQLGRLQGRLGELREACREQFARLTELRGDIERAALRIAHLASALDSGAPRSQVLVVRGGFAVPGPRDVQ
ncbi:MAG: hypothetical protein KBD01_03065 [Acidobacteria bacterium]|nr:hypothetical protein [Acidobacteriota bacterium]